MAKADTLSKLNFLSSGEAFAWTAAVLAFFIPVLKLGIQIPIILLVLTWIWTPKGLGAKNGTSILVFVGIFLFHLIGMAYSENRSEGLMDIEHKLSLFLFPILFGLAKPLSRAQVWRILNFFVLGVFVGVIHAFLTSYQLYLSSDLGMQAFYTSDFSSVHHPSYMAMYINMAIAILGLHVYTTRSKKWAVWFMLGMLILALVLVFPASKMGFLTFGMLTAYLLFMAWRMQRLFSKQSLFVLVTFAAFILFLKNDPVASYRVSQAVQINTGTIADAPKEIESNAARKIVWRIAAQEIAANPLGVGTGDVGEHLDKKYAEAGYHQIAEASLNPHNSYLQFGVALGIPALLWFIFSLIYPFRKIWQEQRWIYGFFLLSIGANLMVESMLETQSGVVFFAFFNALLFFGQAVYKPQNALKD